MTQPISTYPRPSERMTTTPILPIIPIVVESREPIDARVRVLCKAMALFLYSVAGAMKVFGKVLEEFASA